MPDTSGRVLPQDRCDECFMDRCENCLGACSCPHQSGRVPSLCSWQYDLLDGCTIHCDKDDDHDGDHCMSWPSDDPHAIAPGDV